MSSHSPSPNQIPVKFCESVHERASSIENDGSTGSKESATRSFLLEYSTPLDDTREALHYYELPEINDPYPGADWLRVQSKRVDPMDGYLVFIVVVNYEIPPVDEFENNPLDQPWAFSTDVREIEAVLEEDFQGNLFRNTAREFFLPPYKDNEFITVINLTKNIPTWAMGDQLNYQNKVNNADITILDYLFPKHCLLMNRYTTTGKEQANAEGEDYYVLQIQMYFREPRTFEDIIWVDESIQECQPGRIQGPVDYTLAGWDLLVVDQGFNCFRNPCGSNRSGPVQCQTEDGKRINYPSLLDGNGGQKRNNVDYPPTYLPRFPKDEVDFSPIDMPEDIP